jgi:arylsulfatase A-like enzyme
VIQLDVSRTALAAAGIEAPAEAHLEGVDLIPYLAGESEAAPHESLFWRFGPQMAIIQGDWKLVKYDPVVDGGKKGATDLRLYNLADDESESDNVIAEEPAKARELQAAWDKWNQLNVPPLWDEKDKVKRKPAAAGAADGKRRHVERRPS